MDISSVLVKFAGGTISNKYPPKLFADGALLCKIREG